VTGVEGSEPRRRPPAMTFTVLGGSGYIGSQLVAALQSQGIPVWSPRRDEDIFGAPLGHVIYCIAVTTDFSQRPYDTVHANVWRLAETLARAEFASLLYLSSAHLYVGSARASEDAPLSVSPGCPQDLYRISKIMGEAVCRASARPEVRVARLSTVYGRGLSTGGFLDSIIREALEHGRIVLRTSLGSERDFVGIDDVVRMLPRIAQAGRYRVYNVASGVNTTNERVLAALQHATGCDVEVSPDAPRFAYPRVDVSRIRDEFSFAPSSSVLESMSALVAERRALRERERGRA